MRKNRDELEYKEIQIENVPLKVTLIYLVFGLFWIFTTDRITALLFANKDTLVTINIIKGWTFVAITCFIIFITTRISIRKLKSIDEELYRSNVELATTLEQLEDYQNHLQEMAFTDALTGLPNRRLLMKKVQLELSQSRKKKTSCALIFMNMDNFEFINDSFGHTFGDKVLIAIGKRLSNFTDPNVMLFRAGGDELVFLYSGIIENQEVENFAAMIVNSFKEPFQINENVCYVTPSIGVSIYPDDAHDFDQLFKHSDMAMYEAKANGKNRYFMFSNLRVDNLERKIKLEKYFRGALERREFVLYYQPQADCMTGNFVAYEALIRWNNPELGLVGPLDFIDIAEETGLIVPIGEWVLSEACQFIKQLNERTSFEHKISVNISVIQLMQNNFADTVLEILRRTQLKPELLELEITESAYLDSHSLVDKLYYLRDQGVNIALDDFGKGYSSLSYLRRLPINTLKIDKSFIDDIMKVDSDKMITDSIIDIGHKIGLTVVAEGVETPEQLECLKKYNCDKIQGFLFSKPMPADECSNVPPKK